MNLLQYLKYLWPPNPFAKTIVIISVIAFFAWLLLLLYLSARLQLKKRRLFSCSSVTDLRKIVAEAHIGSGEESFDSVKANGAFKKFISSRKLPENDPITMHVKTIFEAGCYETRLDVSELLRHTSQRLFSSNALLRSLLGLFIVLGLLGTLVGLADSLREFSGSFGMGPNALSNANTRSSIYAVLKELRGAFAPSIIGVALTVIGVFIFALYHRLICGPVQNILDQLTINIWVPQMIPTTPQRLVETLRRSEEQMRQSFHAAEKVAEFAKEIQDEASEFNGNLKASNRVLKQLSMAGTSLSSFSAKFEEGTGKLVSFQEDLRSLYKESLTNSSTLRENVGQALRESQEYQATIYNTLRSQNEQLQTVALGLRSYETAYLSNREKIDQALQKLLESITKVLSQIETKNVQLIEKFGDPLIQKLHDKLSGMEDTLNRQLLAIVTQYKLMDAPMNDAAQKVSGALEAIDRRTTALKEELQRAFLQREENGMKELSTFNDLGKNIKSLLEQIESSSHVQSQNMQSLTQSITSLQAAIKSSLDVEVPRNPDDKTEAPEREERGFIRRLFGSR